MDYKERDQAAEFFRDPNGARYLVATHAAGEGINLQFCWLLVNDDISWNPARIEQRMGRVHRYKQSHDVLLLNLVAAETREGRVLKVLLDKLERIRKELGTDKIFESVGNISTWAVASQVALRFPDGICQTQTLPQEPMPQPPPQPDHSAATG